MRIPPRDPKNYLRLKSLPADKAIRFYLEGRFTIGEETALVEAVQNGMSLDLFRNNYPKLLNLIVIPQVAQASDH
jgi:hypothetical protein